ncbi:MAG: 5-oxoprolinase subunit PxpA [Armatimonadota bacterium]|nr:5-oxoprolinase subunit PxpA [Armatimonadota bacterium]MDR7451670.1 5-oxoprolinase subunit PxpA [Armatimonadota bacterium]MDR7465712.1 5-oxoprolinase subunit PxpA [Armatimonadota bacterium]MDR7493621.1 5-oxoprolinase subunit PxpA [Armatimonadota bacterium]MDR7499131.1 5-oxoprolinase subunit PxpA [Armatimonadota bacterium]
MKIDLNADLGEGASTDTALLAVITSANIACGGHAGDERSMRRAVLEATARGVGIGAHPSYPDREGFGRRPMAMSHEALVDTLVRQIERLQEVARAAGTALVHIKAHGALYNVAVDDAATARAIGEAIRRVDSRLIAVALAGSPMAEVFRSMGLRTAEEAFIDRGYTAAGRLVPRDRPNALLTDARAAAARAVRMVRDGVVDSVEGAPVRLRAQTLCVHADTPGSPAIAAAVRQALEAAGIRVAPMRECMVEG